MGGLAWKVCMLMNQYDYSAGKEKPGRTPSFLGLLLTSSHAPVEENYLT